MLSCEVWNGLRLSSCCLMDDECLPPFFAIAMLYPSLVDRYPLVLCRLPLGPPLYSDTQFLAMSVGLFSATLSKCPAPNSFFSDRCKPLQLMIELFVLSTLKFRRKCGCSGPICPSPHPLGIPTLLRVIN